MNEAVSRLFSFSAFFESHQLKMVILLTVGFVLASLLGYFSIRLKLSPILGYLLAGYFIGPFSPGFVADLRMSEQLAEIGVILMMFSVGLNFKLEDLNSVKKIAIPGAVGQTFIATFFSVAVCLFFGWNLSTAILVGLAIGVASTVVLVHILMENHLVHTKEGHIAIGWLVVEDIITVVVLVLLPLFPAALHGFEFSFSQVALSLGVIVLKLLILAVLLLTIGHRFVAYILSKIAKTRSHELFTLSLLALTFLLAAGSTLLFGISIALGAFIAGMIIGQTELRDQALVHSRPMKDAFVVVFFLSVGMLFNPSIIVEKFPVFISLLLIILLIKPIAAFLITVGFKYPYKTGVIVAAALAQIGEFSFILSEEAMKYNLITDDAYDMVVACALVSIAINPLLFKLLHRTQEGIGR